MSAACHARDHAKVSAVSKHAGIARTTLYHAISDPSSVGVGTADKIIAAVNAVCGKGF
jgi:DNA-binding phage protein